VSKEISLHETFTDEDPVKAGSDRAFGLTVGSILLLIGAAKALITGALAPTPLIFSALGATLLVFAILAPWRLSALNRVWLRIGATIAKVVNPIILALLFFLVVTPLALIMRTTGRRPLRLGPDRNIPSYWIERQALESGGSNMGRQF